MTDTEHIVFVGNVPFSCTTVDFQNYFKDLDGYDTSYIVNRYNTNLSKGFGYLKFKTAEHVTKFLDNNNTILLDDRMFKFSKFKNIKNNLQNNVPKNTLSPKQKIYKLFVGDLKEGTTKEELYTTFNIYPDLITCYVNVNKNKTKTTGVLMYGSHDSFVKVMKNPPSNYPNVQQYTRFTKNSNSGYGSSEVYNNGFTAGYTVGFQEGMNKVLTINNK